MKQLLKINSILCVFLIIFSMAACTKKENPDNIDADVKKVVQVDNEMSEENENDKEYTDEEKAIDVITSYVAAAKKLDFDSMNKYITDNQELPILESYREAYSPYSVNDSRIKELCRARLGTYKISIGSVVKNGDNINATVSISMVNMESLQNKWMETLCNKYPEYTTLGADEMSPEVVDVLIQTMIDVLKESTPSFDVKKEIKLIPNGDSWIINAKNEDFFPSN